MIFKDLIHKTKKILSITLALVMVLGFLPANAVKTSASQSYNYLVKGVPIKARNPYRNFGKVINPQVYKYKHTLDQEKKVYTGHGPDWSPVPSITIHRGATVTLQLAKKGGFNGLEEACLDGLKDKKQKLYVSFSNNQLVQKTNELEVKSKSRDENLFYNIVTEGNDANYPTCPGGYSINRQCNTLYVDIEALKEGTQTLYVFSAGTYISDNQKSTTVTDYFKITINVIRCTPDKDNVQMYSENDKSVPVNKIPIIKGIKTEINGEETIIQEASKITLQPAIIQPSEDETGALYNQDIMQEGDVINYKAVGSASEYFEVTQAEDGKRVQITQKKEYYNSEGNDSLKAFLRITYITDDAAFKERGYDGKYTEPSGYGASSKGWFIDEETNTIKYKVTKDIPIYFSDNLDDVSPIKYKFKNKKINNEATYTDIKSNTLVLNDRIERAYTRYDSLHVNDGYIIKDIQLGGEDVKNYITTARVIQEDEYFDYGVQDAPPARIYEKGECVLEYNANNNGGKERTSGTPNKNRAYIKLTISGPGDVIYTPTLYISVPHPVYKLNNGNVHLTIQGDRKENKNINLTGVVDKKEFIKLNRGQEYKTIDNLSYDYEKTQFKVSSGDTVSNVCDVDMYGNIQAKNPGTATIKVTLPPTQIFADRYANFGTVGPMHTWRRENGTNYYLFKTATGYDEATSYSTLKMSDMVQSITPTCTINVVVTEITEDLKFPEADYENNYRKVAIGSKINYQPIVYPTGNNHFVSKQFEWYSDNPEVANVDATTGEVTALKVGKTTIHATTTDGSDLDASYEITVVTKAPTNIACKNKADGVQLSWDSNKSATSYNVYRRETQDGEATEVGKDVNATTFTDTTAQFDKTYYYSITCNAGMGKDFESNESSLVKHKYEVATPTIDSVKLSGSSATITITGTKFKGYVLYYGTSEKASNMIGTTTSKETTINLKEISDFVSGGKLKGGTYYFRAKAYATKENDDGDAKNYYSGYSNSVKLTIQSTDSGGTVAPITVNKDGSLTVKVTAKKVNSAKKYQIRFYKTKKNAKKNKKAVVKKTSKKRKFKINISKKTLKKKKLTKTKKLYYRIRAKKGKKWKKWSKVKSVKIK